VHAFFAEEVEDQGIDVCGHLQLMMREKPNPANAMQHDPVTNATQVVHQHWVLQRVQRAGAAPGGTRQEGVRLHLECLGLCAKSVV